MKVIITLITVLSLGSAYAQNMIHGYVYEQDNSGKTLALPGVNVYWAETTIGTSTDNDGRFTLEKTNKTNKLVFSYISYVNDTVTINNTTEKIEHKFSEAKELDDIVVAERTTSFHSSLEAASVQHITGGELHKAACCNLSESFETNASVDVSYSDAVSGAKQIELLGLAGKYSQILAEKIPHVRGLSSSYGLGYIPGSWMDGISISKGTSSVVDGFEAITGQINVEYKKPDRGEIFYFNGLGNSIGKLETNLNGRLTLGIPEKWSTALLIHAEDNSMNIDMNDDGFLDAPKVRQYNFINRWKFKPSDHLTFQAGVKFLDETRVGGQTNFDGTIDGLDDSYGLLVETDRLEAFLKGGYIFKKPETSIGIINSFTYYDQTSYIGQNEYMGTQNSFYGNYIFQSIIGNTNHSYSTGLSVLFDDYDENFNQADYDRTEFVPGAFFQYTYKYLEKFTAIAGIRVDNHNTYSVFYTPRLNMRYTFPKNFILRASAGKGYRTANIFAENTNLLLSSRTLLVTEDIDQEEAWNFGLTLSKKFNIKDEVFNFYAEFYRTNFINRMIVDLDSDASKIIISNLDGKSYSNVAQLELSYSPVKGMELLSAFRLNDIKKTTNGSLQQEVLKSRYKALFNASYQLPKKTWQFDFTTQLNGGGRLPENYVEDTYDAFLIFNAQITKYIKKWEIYIGGENLGNFTQEDPIISADNPYSSDFDASGIWGPIVGRKFFLGVRYAFEKKDEHRH